MNVFLFCRMQGIHATTGQIVIEAPANHVLFSFVLSASLCKILISSFAHKMDFANNFSVDFF